MSNETLKFIAKRFSCRDFSDRIPADGDIEAIANAAIEAPSAMNRQPWQFIVVKNKDLIDEMGAEGLSVMHSMENQAMYERIMSRGGKLFYNAPRMILIALKTAEVPGMELIDCGIAAQNIAIAASSLGMASLHCGLVRFAFLGDKAEDLRERLCFPEGYECSIAVLLGYTNEELPPHEPDSSKITFID